ncbi:phosphoribosylaminoimidazolesuccinocarboxamide synthase [Halococcus saccharolyticus]|uniref:phosphoribosylaminoimidazolesuccinocarboxamide synthase n=1 Tax=Halococcus saccharolyticus DSM 5350 TaxID=1227455 RepID=M0MLU9_9EURY|nr:phosphoribosylaminoimidazolesuccinocarboxamide synthase [Halococcus saccharolyticus]EMA46662.1 phosphoribosylaminoimidazole-succinocarboxamide synthase [Halococcus saccharolyticus DSM 5350]
MTSVKEFRVEEPATADAPGRGRFVFTDAYSVFDWGQMPDTVPEKGRSLCAMGAYNFELLEAEGVPTHYRGVVDPTADDTDGEPETVGLDEAVGPPREMAIDLVQVPDLPPENGSYDYETFHAAADENYLVPLEIVFRNSVPVGSSLRSRRDPVEVGLDTTAWPDDPVDLPEPVVEFSTKFEEQDRYLTREEADRIAGQATLDDLAAVAREVNRVVTDRAESVEMTHEDGKIECCYVDGEVRVADVVGTFDENRFSYDGQQISKEVLRQYHKRTQPEWVAAVDAAKTEADEQRETDWRALCERDPESLDEAVIDAASDLYTAGANTYLDRELFDAPALDDAVAAVRSLGN